MKKVLLVLAPSLIVLIIFGMGYLLAIRLNPEPFSKIISANSTNLSLAQTLSRFTKEVRTSILNLYPNIKSESGLEKIAWTVPNVPTPFIGAGPMAGLHNGVRISKQQIRGIDRELSLEKKEYPRIFITGGSVAFGSGATNDEAIIGSYLKRSIEHTLGYPVEVLTLANPSWVSTHERIVIENRIAELNPDIVISISGFNDIYWGFKGLNIFSFRTFADELFWQLLEQAYILAGNNKLIDPVASSSQAEDCSKVVERLIYNIKLSTYAMQLHKAYYVFVLQPISIPRQQQLFLDRTEQNSYIESCYPLLRKSLSNMKADNFLFIDLSQETSRTLAPWFIDSVHLVDKGNEILAENLTSQIVKLLDQVKI